MKQGSVSSCLALALLFGGLTSACGSSAAGDSGSGNAAGTAGTSASGAGDIAGMSGAAGTSGSSGGGGAANGSAGPSSGPTYTPPSPPSGGVPQPAGAPGNLTVLNWAGFKAAASFTFDDSLTSQVQHYDELENAGVHLTFFVVANGNGTFTWAQAAKDGHELGNHTAHHCHADGTGCGWGSYAGSLEAELDQCTTYITQTLGQSEVWTAASPYGDVGYAAPDASRFLLNRGVNGGTVAANDSTSPDALPCHTAAMGETQTTPGGGFNGATDAAETAGKWQIFLIHSLGGDGGYNPVDVADVTGAIEHATSLTDVWVDSMVHVGAYWLAQKLFSGLTPTNNGDTQTWSWTLPAHFPGGQVLRVKVDGGTLAQNRTPLIWSDRGYYEIALDAGSVTLSP
jgi:peptidoglycan/xylan/chitin deacetylase (PgdA/CDA1 family)